MDLKHQEIQYLEIKQEERMRFAFWPTLKKKNKEQNNLIIRKFKTRTLYKESQIRYQNN